MAVFFCLGDNFFLEAFLARPGTSVNVGLGSEREPHAEPVGDPLLGDAARLSLPDVLPFDDVRAPVDATFRDALVLVAADLVFGTDAYNSTRLNY